MNRLVVLSAEESLIKSYSLEEGDMPEIQLDHDGIEIIQNSLVLFDDAITGETGSSESFRIINAGSNELIIGSITSGNKSFQVVNTIDTLIGGASGSFFITFAPSKGGSDSTVISIRTTNKTEIPFSFCVKGTGLSPAISLEQAGELIDLGFGKISFEEIKEIHDTTLAITIRNTGNAPLEISGIISNYPEIFEIGNMPANIPSNSYDEFLVTFNPDKAGFLTGMINVKSSDPVIKDYLFLVEGSGIAAYPDIAVTQSGINLPDGSGQFNFDTLFTDEDSTALFVIHNNGENILSISGISSDNPVIFVYGDIDTILAGSSDTLRIKYDPTTQGTSIANISIVCNDPDENPYTFTVRGTYKIIVSAAEIPEGNSVLSKIRIYPNPTSGDLTIEAESEYNLKIRDIYGRLLLTKQIYDSRTILDLDEQKGIVILELQEGNTLIRKLIVVE